MLIAQITAGGAADNAGLQAATLLRQRGRLIVQGGDVIVAIDGHAVTSRSELLIYLEDNHRPGDQVTLSIIRDGSPMDVPVTLGAQAMTS